MFNFYIMIQLNNISQIIINNMKKTKYNIKTNNLSPSIEGSRNFEKISQSLDAKNFSQKTETPFVLVVCNRFLDILGFDTIINESIRWDQDQWKVPPCKLARSIILTPFLRVDKRCPLYRIEEGYEGLNVTYGHSKDKHPELKQVMTGMLTDEYGIPIYEQTLDGNTSDSTWIKSAIHYLQGLLGDKSGDYTFIADSKLVNKKNLEVIYADESPIKFISSCPSSFS